jgi:hypothetical protein
MTNEYKIVDHKFTGTSFYGSTVYEKDGNYYVSLTADQAANYLARGIIVFAGVTLPSEYQIVDPNFIGTSLGGNLVKNIGGNFYVSLLPDQAKFYLTQGVIVLGGPITPNSSIVSLVSSSLTVSQPYIGGAPSLRGSNVSMVPTSLVVGSSTIGTPSCVVSQSSLVANQLTVSSPSIGSGSIFTGLYNYNAAYLAKWRAGRAAQRAGTRNAIVSFIGDSTTAGIGGGTGTPAFTNLSARGFIPQAAALITGASWQSFFSDHNMQSAAGSETPLPTIDARVVFGGTWQGTENPAGNNSPLPCAGGPMLVNIGSSSRLTFTPTIPIDTVNVYVPTNTGILNPAIDFDGTSAGTMTTNLGAGGVLTGTFTVALGYHTIGFTGASPSFIGGMYAYNSAVKEISLINFGWGSSFALDWSSGNLSSGKPWAPLTTLPIWPAAPDLTFISLTINDWVAGTDITTWSGQMQAIITAAKAVGDVVLMTGVPSNTSSSSTIAQQLFVTELKSLAVSNNCIMIDWTSAWGSWSSANSNGWMYDNLHPNYVGYGQQAVMISSLLNS